MITICDYFAPLAQETEQFSSKESAGGANPPRGVGPYRPFNPIDRASERARLLIGDW